MKFRVSFISGYITHGSKKFNMSRVVFSIFIYVYVMIKSQIFKVILEINVIGILIVD